MSLYLSESKLDEGGYVTNASVDKIFAGGKPFPVKNNERAKYIWKVENISDGMTFNNGKRLKIELKYNQDKNEVFGIILKKFNNGKEVENISINIANLAEIQEFINYLDKIDLRTFTTGRIYSNGNNITNQDIIKQIHSLLNQDNIVELINTLLQENHITTQDLVNTGYRKRSLETFKKLMTEDGYIQEYKQNIMMTPKTTDEKALQHFFQHNKWIFGYGLDYRFIDSSHTEVQVGYGNIDFASFNKFSVLVEIKTPNTTLITKSLNRADSWSLSKYLINSVSQILAYKANWQIECENKKNRESYDSGLSNYTADPKSILIIGTFKSLIDDKDDLKTKRLKQETFELFRRDSRNIEIITYDELYERACFIVNDKQN